MQLHCLHADAFAFEARTQDPDPPDAWGQTEASVGNCLVVFVAVETGDARRPEETASDAAGRIESVAAQLGESTVVLVPAPELTDSPADRAVAATVLPALEASLDLSTRAVALGYDAAFELDARGHPFASQHVHVEPGGSDVDGEWLIASPGDSPAQFRAVADEDDVPLAEIDVAEVFERVDGGPVLFDGGTADGGRLLPSGVLMRDLLVEFVREEFSAYGAVPVEPYPNESGSSDIGAVLGDELRSDLPLSLYGPGWFGAETDGPAQRTPTLVTLVDDTGSALDEILRQAALLHGIFRELGLEYEPVVRTGGEFYDAHAAWLAGLPATFGQSVPIERRADAGGRFDLEFVVTDGDGSRLVAPSVTLGDGTSAVGREDRLLRVRSSVDSPVGLLAAVVLRTSKRDRPGLPTWLAPVQLRLVPIEPEHVSHCDRLAERLESAGIRVDVDDRDLPVSERLRAAKRAWIPYDAVIGDEEVDGGEIGGGFDSPLGVTVRAERAERTLSPDELRDRIGAELDGRPRRPLPFPRRHSRRPAALE